MCSASGRRSSGTSSPASSSAPSSPPASTAASATSAASRRSRFSKRPHGKEPSVAESKLHHLAELGQSPWIDFLSRDLLHSNELRQMMRDDAIVGVTSNPTIFQKAISAGHAYDEQLRELAKDEDDPKELFWHLAGRDVQEACDLLREAWDNGARGRDGNVSLEVDPTLAHDTKATIDQAQRLVELVDRPNL